ncbi:hypothetical protein LEM8419_01829 [Neolewinella maritima]|uniref:ATP-binding protein n=1 Tax=Neolewinella maritima TaxID=1383882 RepID=A0ABN8F7L1_9BACT|nr:ATP-binding protein [Neolewinella maritima]CAH1000695.1 hypothetical protein LEM8419_01829 [Neolewinella maritima]
MSKRSHSSSGLIVVTGLPGTGKSTFARALGEATGATPLNTDIIRGELGLRGQYGEEEKERVYRELVSRTERTLRRGRPVIVDGTFYRERFRKPFRTLARALNRPLYWIELRCDPAVVKKRINTQRPHSEADYSVYKAIKQVYEPLRDAHLTLDTDRQSLTEMLQAALRHVAR